MQSKTSFFNLTVFKKNLGRTWAVGAAYLVFLIISIPFSMMVNYGNQYKWDKDMGYTPGVYLLNALSNYFSGAAVGIFAIIALMFTFGYLYVKRDSYMMHSFPVSRKSLYFTGILSSAVVLIVPVIITALITTACGLAIHTSWISAIWYWALIQIVASVFFIGFGTFCMMLSGQAITAVIFYFILNFVYVAMEFSIKLLMSILCFGMGDATSNISFNGLTPMAYITSNIKVGLEIDWSEDYSTVAKFNVDMMGGKYLAIYAVVGIAFIALAYLLYKFKKLETVNDFITVPIVKPIFSVGMSFFISVVVSSMTESAVFINRPLTYGTKFLVCGLFIIIYGVIFYYITLMLIAKSVRIFNRKNAYTIIAYSVCALAVVLCIRLDVFKVENKVPAADDISWVGISDEQTFVVYDQDEINQIINIHKQIINDKTELRDLNTIEDGYCENSSTLYIKYKLKNGKTVSRSYYLVDPAYCQTDSYNTVVSNVLDYFNNPTRIKEHVIGKDYASATVTEVNFSKVYFDEENQYYNTEYVNAPGTEAEKLVNYNEIYQALLKDIDEGNALQTRIAYTTSNESDLYNDFDFTLKFSNSYFSDTDTFYGWDVDGNNNYTNYYSVTLNDKCKNTLAALKKAGFYTEDSDLVTMETVNNEEGLEAY